MVMETTTEQRRRLKPLSAIMEPRSVAIIGASRKQRSVGNELFRNLFRGGFTGPVYPVNPNADHVAGVRAYKSVADIPDTVDLAVVCVPAAEVVGVAQE